MIGRTAKLACLYLQLPQEEAFALPYKGKTMKEYDGLQPETRPYEMICTPMPFKDKDVKYIMRYVACAK